MRTVRSPRPRGTRHAQPRIVHVTPLSFGQDGMWGGGERYALELARHVARHAPTRLVTFGKRARRARLGELEIHVLPARARYRSHEVNPVSELLPLELLYGEVLHAHHYHSVVTNACVIQGRLAGKRVFVTDHNSGGRNFASKLRLHRWVNGLLAVSEFAAARFPEMAGRTRTVYAGVDQSVFRPGSDGDRDGDVLFVGRLHRFKGVDVLIRALGPDMRLDVYGPTYDRSYMGVLHEVAEGRSVAFHSPPSSPGLVAAYQRARVAVLPSIPVTVNGQRHSAEFLPLVLLEAFACGTPVVATAVGGIPEVVVHGENGLIVPPDDPVALHDAIQEIRSSRRLRRRMSDAAVQTVRERFTWSAVAERCLAAYGLA
jgi:glycosyltransferase involved in cell wall biosynthesis